MMKNVLGIEVTTYGVKVSLSNTDTNLIISGSTIANKEVDPNGTAESIISSWTDAINECLDSNSGIATHIGMAIPGQLEFENGISYIKDQKRFDSLYGLNIKELLSEKTNIPANHIKIQNSAPAFLLGEVLLGTTEGYKNILGFSLESGFGTARYHSGEITNPDLWKSSFKDGIVVDYLGRRWLSKRYQEFTGYKIVNAKELSLFADSDDSLGQLVFNEYSDNFAKFLIQCIKLYGTDCVVIGGHDDVWDWYIPHVKNCLKDKGYNVPIKKAIQEDAATLIGAAGIWTGVTALA